MCSSALERGRGPDRLGVGGHSLSCLFIPDTVCAGRTVVAVTVQETLVTEVNTEWGSSSVSTGLALVLDLNIVTAVLKENLNSGILLVAACVLLMFCNSPVFC